MLSYRLVATSCLMVIGFAAFSQRGLIIDPATTSVLDPNGDGYVSATTAGFSNDGYYVDEFEIEMFPLPVFGDGDTLNDTQAGPNCGTTDLTVDSTGVSAYAALDADNNLIFRLRLADENPSVEAYTILIDTDGAIGDADPNSTGNNAGFEIDITLITNSSQGVNVYDIDGIDSCPSPVLQYSLADHTQIAIADEVSCGDEDYFIDFYVPFRDLTTEFGITLDSELQFVVLTNISGTCAMAGKISDVGGVDDTEYGGCITCAFDDLASNQCPVPFSSILEGGDGFASGKTPEPELEIPLKQGDAVISGKADPTAEVYIDVYDLNDVLVEQDTSQVSVDSLWSVTLTAPLNQGDSVVAVAQIAGNCDSQASGSQVSFAVVVLNTPPQVAGTNTTLSYTENDGSVPIDPGILASDNEDLDLVYATIQIIAGYESTEDAITFIDQLGITGSYDAGTATMTLSGDATIDDYNTALQNVGFLNTSEDPVESTRTVEFIINDGTVDSPPFTRDISVTSVNDPPILDGTSGSTEYPTAPPPPFVVNNTFSITDADHIQLTGASVQIVEAASDTYVDGDDLIFSNTAVITGIYNNTTGILTLSGTTSLANYAAAINSVEYEYNPPGTANENTRRIDFSASDGIDDSNIISHFVTFPAATNFPPDVVDENGVPIVDGIDVTTNEDSTVEICLTVNDPDGDLVIIDNITAPVNGNVIIPDPLLLCFEYTPDPDYSGTETVTVTVCDGFGNCDATPVDIDIVIDEVNDAPVLAPSVATVDEKITTELCIDVADITDIEGDTHIFSGGTSPNGGTVSDGTPGDLCFDYTPPSNFVGTDMIEVTICDSDDPTVCATSNVSIDVISVNENPIIFVNGIDSDVMTVETYEDSVKIFCFAVVDVDGDDVTTLTINNISGGGTLVEDATEFCYEYTPTADDNGTSVWEITIQDNGTGTLTDIVTVTLNIPAVNDYPTLDAIPDPTAILEDATEQTVNLQGITAGGGETQTLSITAISDNAGLIPNPTVTYTSANTTGSLAYTPVADQSGTATITVTVDDGVDSLNTVIETFNVIVNPVNDQPTLDAIASPSVILEDIPDQAINVTGITAGGGESQTLILDATSDNPGLVPDPTITYTSGNPTGALLFSPSADQFGTANITVTVDDGGASNNVIQQIFILQVDPVNDPPTLNAITDPVAIDEDAAQQTVNFAGITAGGGETQTLTVTAVSDNPALIPNPTVMYTSSDATGSLTYTPESNQFGMATITVTVDDGESSNNTAQQSFTVSVNGINDAPDIDNTSIDVDERVTTTVCVNVFDLENDSHEFISGTSLVANAIITNETTGDLCFNYTPPTDFIGSDQVEITICDLSDSGVCTTEVVDVEVLDVNDSPIILIDGLEVSNISLTGREDEVLDFCLDVDDPEDNNVTASAATNLEGGGILTSNEGDLCYSYSPEENYNGMVVWEVEVCDDGVPPKCATVFIEIDLANVNDAPVTQVDTLNVLRTEAGTMDVLANDSDIDGDDLFLGDIVELPEGGEAVLSTDGTITYTSEPTFRGIDQLTYTIQDSGSPMEQVAGQLVIIVGDNPFTVYQTISPNGDGINDYWHIEGIDFYPSNEVKLYDRFNNLVFQMDGYDNRDRRWDGRRNQGSNTRLEDGTYYYKVVAGAEGEFVGFVVLKTE